MQQVVSCSCDCETPRSLELLGAGSGKEQKKRKRCGEKPALGHLRGSPGSFMTPSGELSGTAQIPWGKLASVLGCFGVTQV